MLPSSKTQKSFFPCGKKGKNHRNFPPENLGWKKKAGKELLLPARILSFILKDDIPECSRAPHQHGHRPKTKSNQRGQRDTMLIGGTVWKASTGMFHTCFPPEQSHLCPAGQAQTWPEAGGFRSWRVDPPVEHICYDSLSLRFSRKEQLFHTPRPLFMTHGRQGDISNERLKGSSLIAPTNIVLVVTAL